MRAVIVAVALVFAIGATLVPIETYAAKKNPQIRIKVRAGCTWSNGGVVRQFEGGGHGAVDWWAGLALVMRCQPARSVRKFVVVLEVRHQVPDGLDPVLTRSKTRLRVARGGRLRKESWARGHWTRHVHVFADAPRDEWCFISNSPLTETFPPTVEPVYARLVVKRFAKPILTIRTRPLDGPVCSEDRPYWPTWP